MRRGLGLLFAISLVLPVGVMTAHSAGAAGTLPKCKSFTGTQTYNPGLPPLSSSTKVKPKVTTHLTIKNCTGGGITGGKSDGSQTSKTATNCTVLFSNAGKPGAPTTGTIKWFNGTKQVATSQTSNVLTVTGTTTDGKSLKAKLVTHYTGGLGKGKVSTAQVIATPNSGWCNTKPLSKVNFHSTSIK
jgi:hypothetical protein